MSLVEAMGRLWPVVAVLALLSGCMGSELRPASAGPGHAPDRVAGRTFCTLVHPITAAGRLFYPARYPSEAIPDADRCFATAAAARAAGLRAASPPPGSRLVAGIYLMPTGASLLRTCRRAAHKLGFAVACPGLAPSPADSLEEVPQMEALREFVLQEEFAGPPSYVGMGRAGLSSIGHMWVVSTRRRQTPRSICFDRTLRARPTRVRGRMAAFVSCPEGSSTHSGHVVLFWREAAAWHLVSLHSHTAVNRRLDLLIARSVRVVGPRRRE